MIASAAIAGGGIIGMSIAWRLAQSGVRVTVFEKGTIGAEASWAGAGMLAPGGEVEGPSQLGLLCMESRALYPEFVRELANESGLSIDYQESGGLDLAYSRDELHSLLERSKVQAAAGIVSKPVTPDPAGIFWPRIRRDGLEGALFYPGDAIVNPRDIVFSLAATCRTRGVSIVQDCPVHAAEITPTRVQIETAQGSVSSDSLIIAAGAWSGAIKVSGVASLPAATPVKGHLIGYQQPDQVCGSILRHGHTYLLQRANGLLIAGASVEHVGFDRTIDATESARLAAQAAFVLPHLAEIAPTEVWTGFRPASDQLHIGPWHSPRIHLAYGHYRNGILLAPVTAQRIARAIAAA